MVRKLGKVWRYNGDLWGYYGFNMEEVNRIYVANIILHSPRFLLGCLSLFGKIITSRDPNPDTLFWHSFWHAVWKYVSHILILLLSYIYIFWHSIWQSFSHILWHSCWHLLRHSIWHSKNDVLSGIYYDMLFGILPDIPSGILFHILSDIFSDNLSGILPELVSVTWSNDKWSTQQIRWIKHIPSGND